MFFWPLRGPLWGANFLSGNTTTRSSPRVWAILKASFLECAVQADKEMRFIADLKPPPPKPSGLLAVGGLKLRGVRFHRLPPDFRFEQKALKQRQEPQLLPPVQRLSRFSLVGVFRGSALLVSSGGADPGFSLQAVSL